MNTRPTLVITLLTVAALATSATCFAAEKFTFLTNWYAQAEHGGFYQAQATGLYQHAGLDVEIKMGGPSRTGGRRYPHPRAVPAQRGVPRQPGLFPVCPSAAGQSVAGQPVRYGVII